MIVNVSLEASGVLCFEERKEGDWCIIVVVIAEVIEKVVCVPRPR